MPQEVFLTAFRGGSRMQVQPKRIETKVKLLQETWKCFLKEYSNKMEDFKDPTVLMGITASILNIPLDAPVATHLEHMSNLGQLDAVEFVREMGKRFGVEEIFNVSIQRIFFEWLSLYECTIKKVAQKMNFTLPLDKWKSLSPNSSSFILSNINDLEARITSNNSNYQKALDKFYQSNASFKFQGFCPLKPHERLVKLLEFNIRPLFKIIKKEHKIPLNLMLNLDKSPSEQLNFGMAKFTITGSNQAEQLLNATHKMMALISASYTKLILFEDIQIKRANDINNFAEQIAKFCKDVQGKQE